MKKNLLLIIAVFVCAPLFAQDEVEALRFSRNDLQGTARGQAMGGAFGALGGDVTGIAINPAGLGVYRSSELSATLGLSSVNMKSQWGFEHKSDKLNFKLENISYVGYFPTGGDDMGSINFAFSYNRLKDFNRSYKASSRQLGTSVMDYIASMTNAQYGGGGIRYEDLSHSETWYYDPWLSSLGLRGGMIYPEVAGDPECSKYISLTDGEKVDPFLDVRESGRIDTYDFSLGTNVSDDFYLGATVVLTDIDYRMDSYYQENFDRGNAYLDNYYRMDGWGTQFRLGVIWRPLDYLRVGLSYHSPTWYELTSYVHGWAETNYASDRNGLPTKIKGETPSDGAFKHDFSSPGSLTLSVAGVLGEQAILSLDYEIKNYDSMNYKARIWEEEDAVDSQNAIIDEDYQIASTLRLGAEYRFTPQFSGRLGYSFVQNPYSKSYRNGLMETSISGTIPHYTIEGDINYLTAGIGYRFTSQFYLDIAFVYRMQTDKLYMFPSRWNDEGEPLVVSSYANLKNNTFTGLATIGYKF